MVIDTEKLDYTRPFKIPEWNRNNLRIDDYIKLEDMNKGIEHIKSTKPGVFINEMKNIHVSTTNIKGYRDWYTDVSREIVEYWNEFDITYFKYEF